jgi:hypothetical protein
MSVPTAASLAARVEELSSVAVRSGASATAIARLLESASIATMHAVALDLLHGRLPQAERVPVEGHPAIAPLRDAA